MTAPTLNPGMQVRVAQTIQGGASAKRVEWPAQVEGTVLSCEAEPTGSWFAHGRNHRVWLLRLRLRKADGEITTINIDNRSVVTVLADVPQSAP
jgi:hypothetical protein